MTIVVKFTHKKKYCKIFIQGKSIIIKKYTFINKILFFYSINVLIIHFREKVLIVPLTQIIKT